MTRRLSQEEIDVYYFLKDFDATKAYRVEQYVLRGLLLEKGVEVSKIINGEVVRFAVKHEHLGVGVYRVWCEETK